MNAYELLNPDGKPSGIWACENCHKVGYTQEYVNQCCQCYHCGKVIKREKNQGIRTTHEDCDTRARQKRLEEQIAKAEKLPSWNGPVYCEAGGGNEGYFESMDELVEQLYEIVADNCVENPAQEDIDDYWPEYVFVAEHEGVNIPDIGDILERVCDEGFDGIDEHLQGVKELEAALDVFREANKGLYMYATDSKRVVAVPKYERPKELLVAPQTAPEAQK